MALWGLCQGGKYSQMQCSQGLVLCSRASLTPEGWGLLRILLTSGAKCTQTAISVSGAAGVTVNLARVSGAPSCLQLSVGRVSTCISLVPLLILPHPPAQPPPPLGCTHSPCRTLSGQIKPEAKGPQTRSEFQIWPWEPRLARHRGQGVWLQNGESLRKRLPTPLLTPAHSILPVS